MTCAEDVNIIFFSDWDKFLYNIWKIMCNFIVNWEGRSRVCHNVSNSRQKTFCMHIIFHILYRNLSQSEKKKNNINILCTCSTLWSQLKLYRSKELLNFIFNWEGRKVALSNWIAGCILYLTILDSLRITLRQLVLTTLHEKWTQHIHSVATIPSPYIYAGLCEEKISWGVCLFRDQNSIWIKSTI